MARRYRSLIFQKLFSSKVFQVSTLLLGISYIMLILASAGIIDLNNYRITYKNAIYIVSIFAVIISVSTIMFSYLQGSKKNTGNYKSEINNEQLQNQIERLDISIEQQNQILHRYLNTLKDAQANNEPVNLNIGKDEETVKILRESMKNLISDEFVTELNSRISTGFVSDKTKSINEIKYIGDKISERLRREIDKLDRKSDINLIIGSLTTIVAFVALGMVVFGYTSTNHDMNDILFHYLPRISFIVFIEVFAFFFLRLYKLNLNDIKYYQNEITNIELKIVSVISSIKFGLKEDVSSIVSELSKTERNFILEKGQTTIEFEKFKYENNTLEKFTKLLKNVLPKLK